MKNKFILLGVILFVWLVLVERVINAIWNISDYGLVGVVFYNGLTTVWLAFGSFLLYLDNKAVFNKFMMWFNIVLAITWTGFLIWDIVDFIATPDLGYLLFIVSPPFVISYCLYWAVKCAMTVKNTNKEVVEAI